MESSGTPLLKLLPLAEEAKGKNHSEMADSSISAEDTIPKCRYPNTPPEVPSKTERECTLERGLRWIVRGLPPRDLRREGADSQYAEIMTDDLGQPRPPYEDAARRLATALLDREIIAIGLLRKRHNGRRTLSDWQEIPPGNWDYQKINWRESSLRIGACMNWMSIRIPFAELRRAFPADEGERQKATVAAETHCEAWLKSEVAAGQKTKSKNDYKTEATKRFSGLSGRAFTRAWANATKNAPKWNHSGRPKASAAKSTR